MTVQAHRMSSIGRVLMALAVLWGIIGLSDVRSWAQESEDAHTTLRGVEGVGVVIKLYPKLLRSAEIHRLPVHGRHHRRYLPGATRVQQIREPVTPDLHP